MDRKEDEGVKNVVSEHASVNSDVRQAGNCEDIEAE